MVQRGDATMNDLFRPNSQRPTLDQRPGCGTLEVDGYLDAIRAPRASQAGYAAASVETVGPEGCSVALMYCEKEGFNPLWKAVNLANRFDLMVLSKKGQSVTAARKLIDVLGGDYELPLFVLHDFDVAGFAILGALKRDTRRYEFANSIEVVDLGLGLEDVEGLEREPAAATKTRPELLRQQLKDNGADEAEIEILVRERVELNAMTSDALIAMVERKLNDYGLKKAIPDDDALAKAYRAFHHSQELRKMFAEMTKEYDGGAGAIMIPGGLRTRIEEILKQHAGLRWDNALQIFLDKGALDRVQAEKEKAKAKSGDFTDAADDEGDEDADN
jgi:hypothetical protein